MPVRNLGAWLGGHPVPLISVREGGVSVQPAVRVVNPDFVLSKLRLLPPCVEHDKDGVLCFLPRQPVCLGLEMFPLSTVIKVENTQTSCDCVWFAQPIICEMPNQSACEVSN